MVYKFFVLLTLVMLIPFEGICSERGVRRKATRVLRTEIIARADEVLYEKPVTVSSFYRDRSAGGSIK